MLETEANSIDAPLASAYENLKQCDFIQKDLNFEIESDDNFTKASLNDHSEDDWMDILGNGQLRKKVLTAGLADSRPKRSDVCVINFTGKLDDGTIVEEEHDLAVQLGDMEVIQGLDLALALMDTKEVAEVEVSSRFAYGSLGRKLPLLPEIPPNSKLIYNVFLKSITIEPDIDKLQYSEKRRIGNRKRERGNWWFARGECSLAIQCYRKALDYLSPSSEVESVDQQESESTEYITDAELQVILEDALKVHNNLAAAQMKCEAYDAALKSVENVLRCQPQNVKALFRKGKILHYKGEHTKACSVLAQALKIAPDNKAIQQELSILKKKSVQDARHEKNLYRKMLGSPQDKQKDDIKSIENKKKVSTKFTLSLLGGTMMAVAGIIAYKFTS